VLTGRRNGHGCMLQYALLHLFGYKVTMDDLKHFRVCATWCDHGMKLTRSSKLTASLLVIPNLTILLELKSPPAPWDKVLAMPLAWLLLKLTPQLYSTSLVTSSSITTPTPSSVMAAPWRVLPARLPQLLAISSLAT
jgi:hypothetical protein